jgi:hypothetical protein
MKSVPHSNRKVAAIGLFGLAIVAVVFVAWNLRDSVRPHSSSNSTAEPTSGLSTEAKKVSQSKGESPKAKAVDRSKEDRVIHIRRPYDRYLDEICPRLSAEEEDRLAAESGGDPNVLVGLVFGGSKRSEKWLREALQNGPENSLVHYAILLRKDSGFDRLKSAQKLAELTPQDASPLQDAAVELLKRGDQEGAIAALREAAGRDQCSTLYSKTIESILNTYKLAGRSENDARVRVLLEGPGRFEGRTILELGENLGFGAGGMVNNISGKEEAAALVLDACQKRVYSQGLDLDVYRLARGIELNYLREFLRSGANTADRSTIEKYFTAPLSETFSQAKAERDEMSDVLLFSADKPGIYQRLNPNEKSELIERIMRDGEVSAYHWAYQTRRDIFRSPDFVPQGYPADGWKKLITAPGRIPVQ